MPSHCLHITQTDMQVQYLVYLTYPKPDTYSGTGKCCKCGKIFKYQEHIVKDYSHGKELQQYIKYVEWVDYTGDGCEVYNIPGRKSIKDNSKFDIEDFKPGNLIINYNNKLCKVLDYNGKDLVHLMALDTCCTYYDLVSSLQERGYILFKECTDEGKN